MDRHTWRGKRSNGGVPPGVPLAGRTGASIFGAMPQTPEAPQLARRLGVFDATMIVMGGIIGAGIFMNP